MSEKNFKKDPRMKRRGKRDEEKERQGGHSSFLAYEPIRSLQDRLVDLLYKMNRVKKEQETERQKNRGRRGAEE